MKNNSYVLILISIVISLSTFCVHASTLKTEFAQCARIQENGTRLACFDNLAKTTTLPTALVNTQSAERSKTKTNISNTKIEPVTAPIVSKDDDFGAEHLKRKSSSDEVEHVVFTVEKLKKGPHKKWRFTFKNGQRWKQTDSNHFRIKVGESVRLKKGVLGAFYLKKNDADSNRSIRVKRLK